MTKAILISIQPQHALNILTGKKTLELRKSVPKNYVGWVYCYVTKGKPLIFKFTDLDYDGKIIESGYLLDEHNPPMFKDGYLNGTIPFRFWFDEWEEIKYHETNRHSLLTKLCLSWYDVIKYAQSKDLYAWKISKLEIFDKPMALGEFEKDVYLKNQDFYDLTYQQIIDKKKEITRLTKAPQSMQYVWVRE